MYSDTRSETRPRGATGPGREYLAGRDLLTPLALLIGVVAFLVGDGLIQEEAYAELGYTLAFISFVGSIACIGYLFLVFRGLEVSLTATFSQRYFDASCAGTTRRGEDWPLLVGLMFSPFAMLFSGLAGWVEARV